MNLSPNLHYINHSGEIQTLFFSPTVIQQQVIILLILCLSYLNMILLSTVFITLVFIRLPFLPGLHVCNLTISKL